MATGTYLSCAVRALIHRLYHRVSLLHSSHTYTVGGAAVAMSDGNARGTPSPNNNAIPFRNAPQIGMKCKLTQAGESLLIPLHTWRVILDRRHTCGRKACRRGEKKRAIKCIFVLFPLASGGISVLSVSAGNKRWWETSCTAPCAVTSQCRGGNQRVGRWLARMSWCDACWWSCQSRPHQLRNLRWELVESLKQTNKKFSMRLTLSFTGLNLFEVAWVAF